MPATQSVPIRFSPVSGISSENRCWHVMHGDYYAGAIHHLSNGWHWSSHEHAAGPFDTPREAAIYARDWLRRKSPTAPREESPYRARGLSRKLSTARTSGATR